MCTCRNKRIIRHNIRLAPLGMHVIKQANSKLPLTSLLTCRYKTGIGDDILLTTMIFHIVENLECLIQLTSLSVRRNECSICRSRGPSICIQHPLIHLQSLSSTRRLIACNNCCIIRSCFGLETLLLNSIQNSNCFLPLSSLPIHINQCIKSYQIGSAPFTQHLFVHIQGKFQFTSLNTDIHECGICVNIAWNASSTHLCHEFHRPPQCLL
mmetsp:Transcript_5521/g.10824  ORF Transcript_5521/g.10824 Transcript_5521/m.10824 type:complete len:211 (-) Transcript_5521:1571-2203(-)